MILALSPIGDDSGIPQVLECEGSFTVQRKEMVASHILFGNCMKFLFSMTQGCCS